ncbi:Gfo/Idh/MocA family oxidoreductase [Synechococcus sp. RSCCF101]|uniref:Gfo/Idh/MocA family protein n=1 Tax=Synechococcus sp. RSCCF101 TaxID=2511069 RepID=UPI001245012A|nr:Gfo/Idh/MocA family oxidoreductase [Synechococcus sp. RSCCF101]QEY31647.1 Gfo/Idh/MocA family oxidoreductase [Synechococcus sp. RSCCF101]
MTTGSPIGVAIAGLGFGLKVHLPACRASAEVEPVALWHPRAERLEEACRGASLPGTDDFSALLAMPGVEAVIIATPPAARFDLARRALEAGRHVLLEKPVGLNAGEAESLQRLALERGLSVAVDFEYRAVPLFQQLAALLEQGVLGDPWLIKLDWLMSSRADPARPWNWYSDAGQGGGVIGALATHAVDMLHWLIGPTESISGRLATAIGERPDPSQGGVPRAVSSEDVALAQLTLRPREGLTVPAQVSLSAVARQGRGCWLECYGSEATLVLGSDNQADYVHGFGLWMAAPGQPLRSVAADPALAFPTTWSDGRIAPVLRLLDWWADSIRSGRPMSPGLSEGVLSQRVCDLWRSSAESGMSLTIGGGD